MNKKSFLFPILTVSLLLALYNGLAIKLHLFWITPWLDSPSHVLGGFLAALLGTAFLSTLNWKKIKPDSLFYISLIVLVIGIAWEIFEFKAGLTFPGKPGYWLDTISDIICDLFGGVLAYYFLIKSFYERV